MDRELAAISENVQRQIQERLALKKGVRKKCEIILGGLKKQFCYRIYANSDLRVKRYEGSSIFGADRFGRDVANGILKYIEILKNRGLIVHTAIVLGSRAKGSWKLNSDIDITIIADNLPKNEARFLSKLSELWRHDILSDAPLYMGIEPSGCCSRDEFLKRLKEFNIQALDAIFYGQVVYDDGFWPEVKREFHQMETEYNLSQLNLKQRLLKV
jgi:predicted nucleotidyltransferase